MNIKDYKVMVIIALCIGVVGLSVAFAAMSTTLNITGTSKYGGNEWNIYFDNNDEGTVTGTAEKGTISLRGTSIVINDVILNKPGDAVVYTFDIVNGGLLDAKVESITNLTPTFVGSGNNKEADEQIVKDNYVYTLTYSDGSTINVDDEILVDKRASVKLTIGYKSNVTETSQQQVTVTNIGTALVYTQK